MPNRSSFGHIVDGWRVVGLDVHHACIGICSSAALVGAAVFTRHFDGLPVISGRSIDTIVAGFQNDVAYARFLCRIEIRIDVVDRELLPRKGWRSRGDGLGRPGYFIWHIALWNRPLFNRPQR